MAKSVKRTKRRGNQEGSIFQRKDGRWVAQITYQGPDGKTKLVPKYFHTAGDARRALTATKSKQDAHRLVISGKATVRAWLDVWLKEFVAPPNRAPRTYKSYYDLLRKHIPESIGSLQLDRLAPETLQRHFNTVTSRGHGRTAALLRAVLSSAFNKAVKLRRMESNPVVGTDAIQYVATETDTWTAEQAQQFLDAAEHDRLGTLFTVALSLGLRKGEVCGLKADDTDLTARILHVRRSLSWVKLPGEDDGHWIASEPKRASKRSLPIPAALHRSLIRHFAQRAQEASTTNNWTDSGYLFVSTTGAPLHERNVSEAFHLLCDQAGVPRIRFHDTRHSCGTLLHVQGADVFVIKEVLGHTQLSTTKRYTHVPIQVTRAALDGLETMFQAAKKVHSDGPVTVKTTVKSDGKPS